MFHLFFLGGKSMFFQGFVEDLLGLFMGFKPRTRSGFQIAVGQKVRNHCKITVFVHVSFWQQGLFVWTSGKSQASDCL